jgi:NADPH:quinone reductase-like Zn-dependent oxidoreductase
MKAAVRKGFMGFTHVFSNEYPEPKFEPSKNKDQVLVQIHAAAINPVDYKVPKQMLGEVIGLDFCGTVTKVGANVEADTSEDKISVGDLVFGLAPGSLAEYAIADPKKISKAPKDWTATECAALPVAYVSALQCLQAGKIVGAEDVEQKSVLVFGASGGCGVAGLQLCKGLGVSRIVAVCSKRNEEFVRGFGATEVVDYTDSAGLEAFFSESKGAFDCVYDAISSGDVDYCTPSMDLLKRNDNDKVIGQYTALNGSKTTFARKVFGMLKANQTIIFTEQNRADQATVLELMNKSGARPPLNEMTFDKIGFEEGFELLKSHRSKGKIVYDIKK